MLYHSKTHFLITDVHFKILNRQEQYAKPSPLVKIVFISTLKVQLASDHSFDCFLHVGEFIFIIIMFILLSSSFYFAVNKYKGYQNDSSKKVHVY